MAQSGNHQIIEQVQQKRYNCLAAKQLHKRRLHRLSVLNMFVDVLALSTPVVALSVRFVLKGGDWAAAADIAWEIMAACLFVLSIVKLVGRWSENQQEHSRLMGENIALVSLADGLLVDPSKLSGDLSLFRTLQQQSETNDSKLIGELKPTEQQWAYREALKEGGGATVVCPICGLSPFKFKKKSTFNKEQTCDTCGNLGETKGRQK